MADRSVSPGPSPSQAASSTGEVTPGDSRDTARVGSIVLLDSIAAAFAFVGAGGYLVLKALNDNHSVFMPIIDFLAHGFYSLGLHELPGLPEFPAHRYFAIASFADLYLLAMAALHLIAAAGLLALALGLKAFRAWARRAHLVIAGLILLTLGTYAVLYENSAAPRIGLAVMVVLAIVPSAVLATLLRPRIASLFADGSHADGRIATRTGRANRPPARLYLGLILVFYMLGVTAMVFVVSATVAVHLRVAMGSDQ